MRVLTRLEIIPQQLRGNAYGSSADQQLYGKAREPRKKATPKGKKKAIPELSINRRHMGSIMSTKSA